MTTLEVWAEHHDLSRLVGQAHLTRTRSQVSTTFIYDAGYRLFAFEGVAARC